MPFSFFFDIFFFWLIYYLKYASFFFNIFLYSIWLNNFYNYSFKNINYKKLNIFFNGFFSLRSFSACYITCLLNFKNNLINKIIFVLSIILLKFSIFFLSWASKLNVLSLNLLLFSNLNWLGNKIWIKKNNNKFNINIINFFNKYYFAPFTSIYRLSILTKWRYFRQFNFFKKLKNHFYGFKKIVKPTLFCLLNYMCIGKKLKSSSTIKIKYNKKTKKSIKRFFKSIPSYWRVKI